MDILRKDVLKPNIFFVYLFDYLFTISLLHSKSPEKRIFFVLVTAISSKPAHSKCSINIYRLEELMGGSFNKTITNLRIFLSYI